MLAILYALGKLAIDLACSRRSVGCSGRAPCFRSPIARVFVYVALWLGRRPSLGSFGALSVV